MKDLDDVRPRNIAEISQWHQQVDVAVVGGGCAGLSAAIEARRAGADVLLTERTGGIGGASAMSGGLIYLGGGTALQKACGIEDTTDDMFRFLMAATGPGSDEDKVALYCEGSPEHFDWIVSCGVPFKASIYTGTRPEPPTDDGLMFSGGEDTYPWCDIARPAPRAHVPQMSDKRPTERSSGWMLMHHLEKTAQSVGVNFAFDTVADRLVVDDDDEVCGLLVRRYGDELAIRARKGVVLAAGGFIYNDAMLAQHAPRLLGLNKLGTDGDDGRAIRMAQTLGAGVKHMQAAECAYAGTTGLIAPSIVVNATGHRFINEDTYFGRVGQAVLFRQDGASVIVLDEQAWNEASDRDRRGLQPASVCETVAELEAEMGFPGGSLEASVELYNRDATRGRDLAFGKDPRWLRPLRPPFAAIDLRTPLALTVFTLGGLDTSVEGEVRDVSGGSIPGLYAAGRTTSGIPATGYLSGSSLGDGTFFGRRAGRAAALR